MKLSELMAEVGAPNPDYKGVVTNDDNVLAVNIGGAAGAGNVADYAVVQAAALGVDAQLAPVGVDKQYIRQGLNTTKTGYHRTFKVTGDRYIGDAFQDFALAGRFNVGKEVIVDYVWFCLLNGKGEKGKASLLVNSDGTGVAGETAAIDIDLKRQGEIDPDYTYSA